jgi:hypothetical protein
MLSGVAAIFWVPAKFIQIFGSPQGAFKTFLYLLLVVGWWILYFRLANVFFPTLSTALYVRSSLGADCTWEQARALRPLFDEYYGRHWSPSNEVKSLPPSERLDYLFSKLSGLETQCSQSSPLVVGELGNSAPSPPIEQSKRRTQIAGAICKHCGIKMIICTDGVIDKDGYPVCNGCRTVS